ncbi:MAG: hypothetical protein V3U83_09005 [Acidobacteriota bacterium]
MSDQNAPPDEEGKLVAHFKDGQIRKGFSRDFNPADESFHLVRREGEIASSEEIRLEDLKALFHVKTWGREDRHRGVVPQFPQNATPPSSGDTLGMIKTVLEFYDGEKIFCYSNDYDPARSGFYALPADPADNNQKIFVVSSSLINIQFYRA